MNKWRLLLFSIFALLHITTSERPFIDGRYRCYDHSPRIFPSDKSFSAYETNRERRFIPEIRQLNPPDNYPNSNLRDNEIVRLSRRWQIRDIKQQSRDENRQSISPSSVNIRDKRDDRKQNFVQRTYERTNDLRSNHRHNRLDRNRDTEYQRNIRTTSLSREDYRKQYATRTPLENRDVNRYSNIDRDIRNTHDNNRDQTQRQFSGHNELNTQRFTNSDAMRIGFNHVRYTKTYDRYIHEEPELRNLRTIRSERANDNNKLSNDRNSRLGMQRDLYEDLFQGESRNDRRNNVRSLNRLDSKENKRRAPSDSQINKRSLVRDIANLNSLNDLKRYARVHNRAVHIGRQMQEHRLAQRETSRVSRAQRGLSQPFDRVDINGGRENRLRTKRSSSEEMYLLRMDRINTNSQIHRRIGNNNARSTRNTNEKETLENRKVRENVAPKMYRVNMNSRLEMREREPVVSRPDRRNGNNNARFTRSINEMETSENREVRDDFRHKMNRVNMNARLEMNERESVLSRLDRKNVNNNARTTRNINGIEISVNREVRENVAPKMNRVNMNSGLEMREREPVVSRPDRRNGNNNARFTRSINEMETSENREVRANVRPKMNSRLEMRERKTVISRSDRRNRKNNARSTRNINEMETSEKREVRDNFGLKMNRVNMNSRLEMRELETVISRIDRRNVNSNDRSTRNTNEKEISENREVRENMAPKMDRVNMNFRLEMNERETAKSRLERRKVNNYARSTRNINEMETSENREVRDVFGHQMNRVNMNTKLEMNKRDIRGINENMMIVRRRKVERGLYRDNTIIVRRNVPLQEIRVNELRRSERIQRSINDATNTMSRRTREALSLSSENRIRYDARRNLRESQYVRSRENRFNVERDERQRSDKHEVSTYRIHINNIQRRVQIRASVRYDENRITSRNDKNFASGIHISRSTTENDNRQQSRNVIYENQLSNRRHEERNARHERRQSEMAQVDMSIDMRRLPTVRYDEDNEKPIPVQKLQYENHVFEFKWQYLFYALQAVYIFSIIKKMPNCNQENKHTKWISTWFTPTEYLKMD